MNMGVIIMEKAGIKELIEELMESEVYEASDSYNYMLVLHKEKENIKCYQLFVQKTEDFEENEAYASEYDIFTEEAGETFEIEDFELFKNNAEVVAITDIIEVF
mgnify:CR=1 FL=1